MYIAAGDLLELEVFGNVGGNEDVGEFTVGHEELGDEVDVPVVDAAVLLPWLTLSLAVSLEQLAIRLVYVYLSETS